MSTEHDVDSPWRGPATGGVRMPVLSPSVRTPTGTGEHPQVPEHLAVWDEEGQLLHQPASAGPELVSHAELLRAAVEIVSAELGEAITSAELIEARHRHCLHPLRGGCAVGPSNLPAPTRERECVGAQALVNALGRSL